jgi:sodium-dependent dicarboxylate transporter 2/3/5
MLTLLLPTPAGMSDAAHLVLATTLWMAIWWLSEALPIFATALIPLACFPLGKVTSAAETSSAYMDTNIVLFMGGFFLAMALRKWGLHRRMALTIIAFLGGKLSRLVLGFMVATGFLSMWVSNTATAIMMLPIATAVVSHLKRGGLPKDSRFPTVLFLGIAYGASIGGIATLIGTPPNIVFVAQFAALFPDREVIGFGQWMVLAVPFSACFITITWLFLTRIYAYVKQDFSGAQAIISREREKLGAISRGEKGVAVIFVFTALAWIFRRDLALGALVIPGWANALGVQEHVHDSTVAIIATLLLFSIPIHWKRKEFLLDWESAVRIPWGILLLFGGGIALAQGFQATGLANWFGDSLSVLHGLPVPVLVFLICLTVSFLTELTSNTATSSIFMPILAGTAVTLDIAPELLMIPAAMSASCAFMLPVATPPNAIVFGSDCVTIQQMVRAGLWLNFMGAILITIMIFLLGVPLLGIQV